MTKLIHKYLRRDKKMPHIWCPGCGNGIVLGSLIRAIDKLKIRKDDIVMVSGIGCSGRMTAYVDFNTLHTTHGRALTFATGIKLVNPNLNVITVMGDGDAMSIGGNHFIHAARRNTDLVAIVVNNMVYGMTGGQCSPTTPYDIVTTTTVKGNPERELSVTKLAIAAEAAFVARGTVFSIKTLDTLIVEAIKHKGFSVVEILSNCHTHFGRKNGMKSPIEMLEWFKKNKYKLNLGVLKE